MATSMTGTGRTCSAASIGAAPEKLKAATSSGAGMLSAGAVGGRTKRASSPASRERAGGAAGSSVVRPSTPPWDFSLEDSLDSIERLAGVEAETVYLAHYGAARPGPTEIFDRAADSLERWHKSFLKKREQTDSEEDLSRQFNACLEASLEPIAPSVRRDLETVSPAWLNLAGLSAEQARLNGRLSDAA